MPLSILPISFLSDNILLLMSILVFFALLITKVGYKFGMPTLLLFLIIGMLAGSDVLGLEFDNFELAHYIGELAMTIILLTGGLETDLKKVRPVMKQGVLLSTLGVLLTVIITAAFIFLVYGQGIMASPMVTVLVCLLIASVMSSTDSASVFNILRGSRIRLKENLAPILELEAGSNDPMANVLTLILVGILGDIQIISTTGSTPNTWSLILTFAGKFLLQVAIGFGIGFATGRAANWVLSKIRLNGSPLYSIMILTFGIFANSVANLLWGNGLLALYIASVIMGNSDKMPYRKDILKFLDGITWLAQLLMFLMLGMLASPSQFPSVALPAIFIGLFMIFVARPLSVFLCLSPFKSISFRGKVFVSWVGLKGAGPILFAMIPVIAGLENATDIFNIVFIITLISLLLQGMTIPATARFLKVSEEEEPEVDTLGMEIPEELGDLTNYTLTADDLDHGNTLRDLHLPHGTRVIMVKRGGYYIAPHGSLVLKPDDMLVILVSEHTEENLPEEIL